MHSPAAALAWESWRRYRWELSIFGAIIAAYAAVTAAGPGSEPEKFAALGSMWFAGGLCLVIVVFSYGGDMRLETADSGFPARLFLLPVRTWVLVGWPMIQGVGAAVLAWVAWDQLVLRPCGGDRRDWLRVLR